MTAQAPASHPFAGVPTPRAAALRAIADAGLEDVDDIGRILDAADRADRALDGRRAAIDPRLAVVWARLREHEGEQRRRAIQFFAPQP